MDEVSRKREVSGLFRPSLEQAGKSLVQGVELSLWGACGPPGFHVQRRLERDGYLAAANRAGSRGEPSPDRDCGLEWRCCRENVDAEEGLIGC